MTVFVAGILFLTGFFADVDGQFSRLLWSPFDTSLPPSTRDCATVRCRQPDCRNPIPARPSIGQCCAVCPSTLPPHCAAVLCAQPEPDCSNPVRPEGECCPECPPTLPPRCAAVSCARPECPNPITLPDRCCPVCPGLKPGRCPRPDGLGICVDSCKDDTSCRGRLKCCSNGCGRTCQRPVGGVTKPGRCPHPAGFGICVDFCTDDFSCLGSRKCCSNGCGRTCQSPLGQDRCLDASCPQITCADRYTPPGECCPVCKPLERPLICDRVKCEKLIGCVDEYIPSGECCPVCASGSKCHRFKCLPLPCRNQYTPPGRCCPVCRRRPRPDCRRARCERVTCKGRYIPLGRCCPRCPRNRYR